jgi:hypothetical protein
MLGGELQIVANSVAPRPTHANALWLRYIFEAVLDIVRLTHFA